MFRAIDQGATLALSTGQGHIWSTLNIREDVQKGRGHMYARVTIAQYHTAEAIDEGAQIYRDSILPATQQLKGFKDVITLGDRSTGKAMVITFWETEADAQAGISSGFVQQQAAKLAHLFSGAPTSEVFEVVPVK